MALLKEKNNYQVKSYWKQYICIWIIYLVQIGWVQTDDPQP